MPFKRKTFDYISCIGSLEHFLDLNKGLQEIKRVLKDEGSACIVVPNENFIGWQNKSQKGTAQQEINENLDSLDGWEALLNNNYFEILGSPHLQDCRSRIHLSLKLWSVCNGL